MGLETNIGYINHPLEGKLLVLKEKKYKTCIPINNYHPPGMFIDFDDQLIPLTKEDLVKNEEYQGKQKDGSLYNALNYLIKSTPNP